MTTKPNKQDLTEELMTLLRGPSMCYITTLMPDGSPQLTQLWVDTDGEHIVINTVEGFQKLRNMQRDPRVAVAVSDPATPVRFVTVRGRVIDITTAGGAEHIESLAQKYLGGPYPWYGGRDQTRAIVTISIDKIHAEGA
ncbi:PPOX class F420-dependent oxidoreductase [Mycolicibacterium sp.]|uniref:PPOX class F420-dependent oxidoreductase n=1 Tax=Mycolicibacterium sp. TaxID=2320850 RepID=UPI001A323B1D|nr:PPOX class F420-dependent oxidoreductase [Mycolicibacterium sp.]MBJ7341539.1 PPOX class F420-dependent oxidoreductase [Mycolicibacterium sp.]